MEETTVPTQTGPTPEPAKPHTSWVAVVCLIIAVLAIAGGALYLKENMPEPPVQAVTPETLEKQSDSTEPEAIEADLSAQEPEEFDAEFDEAFAELDASLE